MGLGLRAFYKKQKNASLCRVNGGAGALLAKAGQGNTPARFYISTGSAARCPQAAACSNCCRMASKPGSPCRKAKSLSVRSARAIMAAKLGPKSAFWQAHGGIAAWHLPARAAAARPEILPGRPACRAHLFSVHSAAAWRYHAGAPKPQQAEYFLRRMRKGAGGLAVTFFQGNFAQLHQRPLQVGRTLCQKPLQQAAACPSSPLARWMEARMRAGSNVACGSWPSRASARAVSFF